MTNAFRKIGLITLGILMVLSLAVNTAKAETFNDLTVKGNATFDFPIYANGGQLIFGGGDNRFIDFKSGDSKISNYGDLHVQTDDRMYFDFTNRGSALAVFNGKVQYNDNATFEFPIYAKGNEIVFDNSGVAVKSVDGTTRIYKDNTGKLRFMGDLDYSSAGSITGLLFSDLEGTANAITTDMILNSAVTTAKINDLAVTTGKINDLAVTAAKINDATITGAKLASDIAISTTGLITAGKTSGTGLAVTSNATVGGDLTVTGTITTGTFTPSTLTVSGATALNGDVDLGNALADSVSIVGTVDSSTITMSDAAHNIDMGASATDRTLTINNSSTGRGNLAVEGQIQVGSFSSAPTQIGAGSLYYNSTNGNLYAYDGVGAAWVNLSAGASSVGTLQQVYDASTPATMQVNSKDLTFSLTDQATDYNVIFDLLGTNYVEFNTVSGNDSKFQSSGQVDLAGGYGSTGVTIYTTGNTSMNGNLTVDGTSALVGDVTVTGDVDVNGDNINSDGDLVITGATGANLVATAGDVDVTSSAADVNITGNVNVDLVATTQDVTMQSGDDIILTVGDDYVANVTGILDLNVTEGATLDSTTLSLDGTDTTNLTMTANDAGDKTLTIAATNAGAGTGIIDMSADGDVSVQSTAGALDLATAGGDADSLTITSTNGGIDIATTGSAAGEDIDIAATGSSVNITSTEAAADAIVLNASNAAGGVDINAGTAGVAIDQVGAGTGISLDAGSASNFTTSAGALTLTSAEAATWSATTGILTINSVAAGLQLNTTNDQAITIGGGSFTQEAGAGQVTFTGNVDATNGLDVTTANLTVGGANFSVAPGTGNITTAGDVAVNGDNITSDGTLDIAGTTGLSMNTGTGGFTLTAGTAGQTIGIANDAVTHTISVGTGNAVQTINVGTDANPINKITIGGTNSLVTLKGSVTAYQALNYLTAGGVNNAITGTLNDASGSAITVAAGLKVTVYLNALTLQAGANTFNLNAHGADSIVSHRNNATNIAAAYAAASMVELIFDGTKWQDLSQ